ncbi:MAG: Gfo/Idh/MocA family oxidoreductase [Ruminococcaceae bacterium]|nr:Gfo/Idh/MocA family oxidoreductase [Oscillospiraceae bacterium]
MYNLALIGCGYMGHSHLEEIYLKENICIKGVCDLDPQAAEFTAKQFNAQTFSTNADDYITDPEIDIIIIATYPSSHYPLLIKCLEHGKHVICEKPITADYEEGVAFVRACNEHPECKVLVGHILRHNNTYKLVADMIARGDIGKPIVMRMVQNHQSFSWKKDLALITETSPIIDCGVHYIDVMRWFTGAEVVSVDGVGIRTEPTVPQGKYNHGIITVTMSDGSAGFYEAGWSPTVGTNNTKEFIGPLGRIKIIYQKDRITHKESGNLVELHKTEDHSVLSIDVPYNEKPTGYQLDYLIQMIEQDKPANPTMEDVLTSFRVVCEADRKIREKLI